MYHWVEDKDFLKRAYSLCADIVNQLVQQLEKDGIDVSMNTVGSKKRNMITQNEKEPIDFDFNLLVDESGGEYREKELKETVRKAFNVVLSKNGWDDCYDSKSVLTTEKRSFLKGNKTEFSIDVCIVRIDRQDNLQRLIHEKNGNIWFDQWYWNTVSNSRDLWDKEDALKPDYWGAVRETYIKKKNMYLRRPYDHSHPSFICYIEAVNEVYEKMRRGVI